MLPKMSSHIVRLCLLLLAGCASVSALNNGLARTPPMGWIAWERFTCTTDCAQNPDDCVEAKLFRQTIDRLVADGYQKVGYQYVNIDDCWSEMERDPASQRLVANKQRFPDGLASLAEYAHSRGVKLGAYGDCGTKTCDGYPAQLKSETSLEDNYFELDATTLADWQLDSFKFDGCYLAAAQAESVCPQMAGALNATGRPVLVVCEWPFYMLREGLQPNYELASEGCHAWRYFEDVEDSWLSVLSIVDFTIKQQYTIVRHHGPGAWFDPDQLVVGNFALSLDQARAQMALWCVWSAPLYMGNDLRRVAPEMAAVLKNEQLIGVDQDPLGVFGLMVGQLEGGALQAFVKPVLPLVDGCPSFAVVYLNRNALGNARRVSFKLRDLLTKVPVLLALNRYEQLSREAQAQPLPILDATKCKTLYKLGMTRDPRQANLVVKPAGASQQESVEHSQVAFRPVDLFADQIDLEPVPLNGELSLRVNPSGVRMVKLTMERV